VRRALPGRLALGAAGFPGPLCAAGPPSGGGSGGVEAFGAGGGVPDAGGGVCALVAKHPIPITRLRRASLRLFMI